MRHSTASLCIMIGLVTLRSATAQEHLATKELQSGNSKHFGTSIAKLGDVNGDGVADIAVGAPGGAGVANPPPGTVYVYSGASGSLLYTLTGTTSGDAFGVSVASAGDLNGDGKDDLLVGAFSWMTYVTDRVAHPNGYACIYSGVDGSLIRELGVPDGVEQFGWQVSGLGDIDGDGIPDQAVSAPATSAHPHGKVILYSGATGQSIRSLTNDTQSQGGFGYSISSPGDLTGDGRPDILVGDFSTHNKGCVREFSGADGSLVRTVYGGVEDRLFGACIAGGPDVDGDGTPDFAVGGTDGAAGSIRVFSGRTGLELYSVLATSTLRIGASVDLVSDITGDGHPDLIVGEPAHAAVHIYSLTGGGMAETIIGAPNGSAVRFGITVRALGTVGLAVGADYASNPSTGKVGGAWVVNPNTGQVLRALQP